jgi:hypothetical protein
MDSRLIEIKMVYLVWVLQIPVLLFFLSLIGATYQVVPRKNLCALERYSSGVVFRELTHSVHAFEEGG